MMILFSKVAFQKRTDEHIQEDITLSRVGGSAL